MSLFFRQIWSDLHCMPRPVWVLVGGQFVNRLGGFVYPFLVLFLSQRGVGLGQISAVLGSLALGQLLAPFAGGYLADAIGRRPTIVAALVGGALTLLGLYAFTHPWALCLAAAGHGFCAFMFGPAANALLADLVTPQQRVTAYALLRMAINAGFSMGPAIAGILFAIAPILIFVGDAVTTLLFALLAFFLLPKGLRTIGGNAASPRVMVHSLVAAGRDAAQNRPFIQLYLGMLLMAVGFIQVFHVLALHTTARGLDTFAYGVVMGFNGFLILCCELPLAHLVRRFSARRVLMVGFVITGAGCASFAWAETLPQCLLAMALFTLGEMMSLPIASSYASELAPIEFRGRYFGLFGTVWGVAGLAGSAGPWLYGQFGAAWWIMAGAGGALGALSMMVRVVDRPAAAATGTAAALT